MNVFSEEFKKYVLELTKEAIKDKIHPSVKLYEYQPLVAIETGLKLGIAFTVDNCSILDDDHPPLLKVDNKVIFPHPNRECYMIKLKLGLKYANYAMFDCHFR